MHNKLQKGWSKTTLKEICNMAYGKGLLTKNFSERGYPVFGANGIIGWYSAYLYKEPQVIISCRGAASGIIHKTVPYSYVTSNSIILKLKSNEVDLDYLQKSLMSVDKSEIITGSAQPQITIEKLNELEIPIAPYAEQQRIVAKLDSLFEKIEINKKRLEKIPQILKRFRQSVLAAAIKGRLTTQWRFESGCTEDWENTTLFDVIEGKAKNGYSAKPVNYETPFRVLTLTATTSGIFKPEHFKYFDEKIDPNSEFWIQPNDILIQRGNTLEYVGVSAVYEGETNKLIYPDLMIRVRASEKILTKYLYYVLSAEKSRNYLRERATGTAGNMPKINQPTLNSLPIELPSKREQEEIVKRVEKLFSFADKVESRYLKAKAQLDKLHQSILAKAFRGELVPQDPEDEPANLLLERILTAKRMKKIK